MSTSDRALLSVFTCLGLHLFVIYGQATLSDIDVCSEEHRFRCGTGEVISLVQTDCWNGRICSAAANKIISELCRGQQMCSNLGIGNMLASHCRHEDELMGSIRVKFKCIPGSTSSCQTNICADNSAGLFCPDGSHIHLRRMSCASVEGNCSRSVYTNLFLCEGASRCDASGLKTLLSQNCQSGVPERRNVIMHYVCVPEQHIENKCTATRYRTLEGNFGVLRSQNLDFNSKHANKECKWIINPIGDNVIKVTVHLVNTRIRHLSCDPGVLSITYEDCSNESTVTRSFCIVDDASVDMMSCGQVKISSFVPRGEETADRFILSYEKYHSSIPRAEPSGLPTCLIPPLINTTVATLQPVSPSQTMSVAPARPSSKTPTSVTQNYGPGDGVFEYRDSVFESGATSKSATGESSSVSKQLKLVLLYIFFGVVILVLTVALIAVIISYYRLSKKNDHTGDSSERTALCQPHEDTPLDTFQNHTLADSCGTLTTETMYTFQTDQEVMATVHHDAIPEQDESDHRLSSGSGISTFLSEKQDTDFKDLINSFQTRNFGLYSNLENKSSHDNIRGSDGGYYEMVDAAPYTPSDEDCNYIYEVIDQNESMDNKHDSNHANIFSHDVCALRNHENDRHTMVNQDQQPLVNLQHSPSSDLHYHINNDVYAVVRKPSKQPKKLVLNDNQNNAQERALENSITVNFHPTSGPYDKRGRAMADSNPRWPMGETDKWEDEL